MSYDGKNTTDPARSFGSENRICLRPIGWVRSTRTQTRDDDWDSEVSSIELDKQWLGEASIRGLDSFSHLEVVYFFDRVPLDAIERGARRPRNNPDWPEVGIFAQRGKNRPNRIGVSLCRITSVEGLTIRVAGLDAIDATPVLDIKPYLQEFGPRGQVAQPSWATELMANYWFMQSAVTGE